jgi:hypothetical protein
MEMNEGTYPGEFLVTESPGTISRDTVTVTVAADTTLESGTVLGQITASGKYVPFDDSSSDGRETAAGILYAKLENDTESADDLTGVVINFGAEVRSADLVWGEGVDDDAGLADLAARYIKARD